MRCIQTCYCQTKDEATARRTGATQPQTTAAECHREVPDAMVNGNSRADPSLVALLDGFTMAMVTNRGIVHACTVLVVHVMHALASHVTTFWTAAPALEYVQPTIYTMLIVHSCASISRRTIRRNFLLICRLVWRGNPREQHGQRMPPGPSRYVKR
jgi:hypothetical protein